MYFITAYALMEHFNISCVFLKLSGIPCPGCGMTRALLSVLNLDFYMAFKHNVMIFFMPYVFAYVFFDFKSHIHNIFLVIIAVIAIINWLFKIIL